MKKCIVKDEKLILSKPMVNKYLKKTHLNNVSEVANPSTAVINQLLNYSKSLEIKKIKHAKVLVHLN